MKLHSHIQRRSREERHARRQAKLPITPLPQQRKDGHMPWVMLLLGLLLAMAYDSLADTTPVQVPTPPTIEVELQPGEATG